MYWESSRIYHWPTTCGWMDSPNRAINGLSNTCDTGAICNKITGQTYYQWLSSYKLLAQPNNKKLTIQVTHGKQTKDDMGGKDNECPLSRPVTTRNEGSKVQGTRVHQTHAMPDDRKGQDQIYALPERSLSLA